MSEKNAKNARRGNKARTQEKVREALFRAFAILRKHDPAELRAAWEAANDYERSAFEREMRKQLRAAAEGPSAPSVPVTPPESASVILGADGKLAGQGDKIEVGQPGWWRNDSPTTTRISLKAHHEAHRLGQKGYGEKGGLKPQ